MTKRQMLVGYKFFFGLLGVSAILTEIIVGTQRGVLVPANFFSYFTIESNIFAAIVFLVSAIAIKRGYNAPWLAMLRGAATLYMLITGIVFKLLLSADPSQLTFVPWDNIVLHYIIPLAVLVDWFIDLPQKRIRFTRALVWLVYPIAYVAYSFVRGLVVQWYPYPFLNPVAQGYGRVVMTSLIIAAGVVFVAWLLTLSTRKRGGARS